MATLARPSIPNIRTLLAAYTSQIYGKGPGATVVGAFLGIIDFLQATERPFQMMERWVQTIGEKLDIDNFKNDFSERASMMREACFSSEGLILSPEVSGGFIGLSSLGTDRSYNICHAISVRTSLTLAVMARNARLASRDLNSEPVGMCSHPLLFCRGDSQTWDRIIDLLQRRKDDQNQIVDGCIAIDNFDDSLLES